MIEEVFGDLSRCIVFEHFLTSNHNDLRTIGYALANALSHALANALSHALVSSH